MKTPKWDADDIPNQNGRIAIVTGSTSGIGLETARVLASKGARVILAIRNLEKGRKAATTILDASPSAKFQIMELDLASLDSVRRFVAEFKENYSRLDLLINNAGVMTPPYGKTADGFELQFGTNHLGHFALTLQLLDLLEATPESRVVNLSSAAHTWGKVDFDDLSWEKRPYRKWQAYGDSKISNLYFTFELQNRLGNGTSKVTVAAAHPGWTATELQRHAGLASMLNTFFAQSVSMGALPTLYAAIAPGVKGGDYFGPSGMMEMRGYPKKVRSCPRSHDQEVAKKLWDVSQTLTGVRFERQ